MTEIMPFPENNYETVLLDRPEGWCSFFVAIGFGISGRKFCVKLIFLKQFGIISENSPD